MRDSQDFPWCFPGKKCVRSLTVMKTVSEEEEHLAHTSFGNERNTLRLPLFDRFLSVREDVQSCQRLSW